MNGGGLPQAGGPGPMGSWRGSSRSRLVWIAAILLVALVVYILFKIFG